MDQLLTAQQVSDYLQVPLPTLYQWRYRGIGPRAARVGRYLRYRLRDVDRWMDERVTEGTR